MSRCPVTAILLGSIVALAGCERSDERSPLDGVAAQRGPFTVTATADGEMKARHEFAVDSPTWGRIEWLHANGEPAKKGDLVVKLETRDKIKQTRDLKRDLDTVRKEVEELRANLDIEKERSALDVERKENEVKVARLKLTELAEMPTAEALAGAEADFKTDRAVAESAANEHAEARELLAKGFATEAEVDSNRIDARVAAARRDLAALNLKTVKGGADEFALKSARIAVRRAEINLALAKQNAAASVSAQDRNLKWAVERARRAERRLKKNREEIASCSIKAPRDGIVVHVSRHWGDKIEEGSRVWKGASVVNLPEPGVMKVRSHVSENDVRHLKTGDVVKVRLDPIPGKVYDAKVFWIDNWARDKNAELSESDRKKQGLSGLRVFDFEAEILESDPRLKLGFQAHVTVPLYRIEDAVTIDARAVRRDHGEPCVYVVGASGPARRHVKLGASSEGRVVVTEGLSGDEKVMLR